jgi:hypothetical protein
MYFIIMMMRQLNTYSYGANFRYLYSQSSKHLLACIRHVVLQIYLASGLHGFDHSFSFLIWVEPLAVI